MRLVPILLIALATLLGPTQDIKAQEDELARDFKKLSAKERARIAKEEQEAASKDEAFQAVMAQAEELFRQLRYEESKARFQEARVMRPYNVYPKVKIQDLEALIAKRDAEAAAATPAPPEPEPQAQVVPPPPIPVVVPKEPVPPVQSAPGGKLVLGEPVRVKPEGTVSPPRPVQAVKPETDPHSAKKVESSARKEASPTHAKNAPTLVEGQRLYKEGRSVVLERTLAVEGHLVVFRKVSHPWGEVNYFRDGLPISARTYERAMEGR